MNSQEPVVVEIESMAAMVDVFENEVFEGEECRICVPIT